MHIAVVGLSHRTAPVEVREKLSIPEQTMEESLQNLRNHEQVLEASILSTCNRLEIYTLVRNPDLGIAAVRDFLHATPYPTRSPARASAAYACGSSRPRRTSSASTTNAGCSSSTSGSSPCTSSTGRSGPAEAPSQPLGQSPLDPRRRNLSSDCC